METTFSEVDGRRAPSAKTVHATIRAEGEEELERSSSALAWSGLAAGLSMGFSFLVSGFLHEQLPPTEWRHLIVSLGYPIGFLIVILGRQQLFTENTLKVTLPIFTSGGASRLGNMLRVWGIVLAANLVGITLFALALAFTAVVDSAQFESLRTVAAAAEPPSFASSFLRAILAGWLIALVLWLLPFAETARPWVIVVLTYIIGIASLPHVIASTADGMFRVFVGDSSFAHFLERLLVPALLGNTIGGVALVAAINHAQVTSGED